MLRTSIKSLRALDSKSVAPATARHCRPTRLPPVPPARAPLGRRYYADQKSAPVSARATKLRTARAGQIVAAAATQKPSPPNTPTGAAAALAKSPGIPPAAARTPPTGQALGPFAQGHQVTDAQRRPQLEKPPNSPSSASPPLAPSSPSTTHSSPSPPPKKKGFLRTLRNQLLLLSLLGALAFGGGVWLSRIDHEFRDYFVEHVPLAERVLAYLEEADFRKRYPELAASRQRDGNIDVTIPAGSGASWRVADSGHDSKWKSSTASKAAVAKKAAQENKSAKARDATTAAEPWQPPQSDKEAPQSKAAAVPPSVPQATPAAATTAQPVYKPPEVDEPSRWPPASPIDPLAINDAREPVVQDLVRMLNDIIAVINADGANARYGATIGKAKNELSRVGQKIKLIKETAEAQAAKQLHSRVDEFDKAANDLVSRVEAHMDTQEARWRQEFEAEMKRIKESHDQKIALVLEREKQLNDQWLKNQLLEQAIELQRQFKAAVKQRVEEERQGRLSKLRELSSAIADVEKVMVGWNEVVDSNQRAQQLHVALDAVRASLEDGQQPRPFINELVALKEAAADDTLVSAALSSINPSAYQRGIATAADLIDRFRRVATEVRKASLLPDDAGLASHASSVVLSKMLFKKKGLVDGDDVESILTRTQTYLEEGDLDKAAREMNSLTGWAKTLSRDWLAEVRKVLEVQQALDVIQTEARLQSLRLEKG